MIERAHLDLPCVRKEIRRVHEGRRTGWAVSEKQTGLFSDSHESLALMVCEHGRGCGFESRHPRHPSSMLYKLALSESGCISGQFVGNLSYRLGRPCPSYMRNQCSLLVHANGK